MKPGDLVRLVAGHRRTYGTHDQVGIVIEVYPSLLRGEDDLAHNVQIMFPDFIFKHPNFPITMLEVVSEAR